MRWIGLLIGLPLTIAHAADSYYCPQHASTITLNMTINDVIAACGQPMSKQTTDVRLYKRVEVQQLIYSSINAGGVYPPINLSSGNILPGDSALYNMWSLPSGSAGMSMEVDLKDNKVSSIRINGSSANSASVCHGQRFEVGDDGSKAIAACGSPSLVNNTFIKEPISKKEHPERWVYQLDRYHQPYVLTFINGILQSID